MKNRAGSQATACVRSSLIDTITVHAPRCARIVVLSLLAAMAWPAARVAADCILPAPQNACLPGGGLGRNDCEMEWVTSPTTPLNRLGIPTKKLICLEGDPACDFDPDPFNHSCTFHVSLCLNNIDPRITKCTPSDVSTFAVLSPNPLKPKDAADTANASTLESQGGAGGFGLTIMHGLTVFSTGAPNATANLCSAPLDIVVPLRQRLSGQWVKRIKALRIRTKSSLLAADSNTVRLQCRPALPTPTPTSTETGTPTDTPTITPTPTLTGTPTSTSTPTFTVTAAPGPAVCGDGLRQTEEDCDNGGTCVGGDNAGTHCTQESDCLGNGVCEAGPDVLHACISDTDCPGSRCIHCKVFGDAVCAANCTLQTGVPFPLVTGKFLSSLLPGTSAEVVHSSISLTLLLAGTQTLSIGKMKNGEIPAVIQASTVSMPAIKLGMLLCACSRAVADQTCGGYLTELDGTPATDCTPDYVLGTCSGNPTETCFANDPGFPDGNSCSAGTCVLPDPCAGKPPCTYVHGRGNSASGLIGCNGLNNVNLKAFQDADGNPQPPPPTPLAGAGPMIVTLGDACSCATTSDCPLNGICSVTRSTTCTVDKDCPTGEYCAPPSTCDAAGRCTCTTNADCPGTSGLCLCPNGTSSCPPPATPGICLYDPCHQNTDCPAPLTCEAGPAGSAVLVNSTATGQVQPPPGLVNPCVVPTRTPAPAYGADHIFCTADDPQISRGRPQTLPAVTGAATGLVVNLNPVYIATPGQPSPTPAPSRTVGPFSMVGNPFNCTGLLTPGIPPLLPTATVGTGTMTPTLGPSPTPGLYATGAGVASAFTALNQPTLGTIVVTNVEFSQ